MANLTLGAFNPNATDQQVHAWQPVYQFVKTREDFYAQNPT